MSIRSVASEPAISAKSDQRTAKAEKPLDAVAEALERMRFGVIQLTVHDGRLVQIDVTERRRFA
jgi:hypothetical protein